MLLKIKTKRLDNGRPYTYVSSYDPILDGGLHAHVGGICRALHLSHSEARYTITKEDTPCTSTKTANSRYVA